MNKTELESWIRKIKEGAKNPKIVFLCEAFETFMSIYASRNQGHESLSKFNKQLRTALDVLWDSFYKASDSIGLNGERMLQHMMDPAHFTAEQLKGLQALQQSLEAIEGEVPSDLSNKKIKKKNMRI